MKPTALVVAAHPDDESLGMGGTWFKLKSQGWNMVIIWMTNGASSREDANVDGRQQGVQHAMGLLSADEVFHYDFADNKMDTVARLDIVKSIEVVIQSVQPQRIYTHSKSDLNIDHQIVHEAVMTAARPLPGSSVKSIFGFEVLSATHWQANAQFSPQWFVDIHEFMDKKKQLLTAYEDELRPYPHARSMKSIENLAMMRGAIMGLEYAEAFEVYRNLE